MAFILWLQSRTQVSLWASNCLSDFKALTPSFKGITPPPDLHRRRQPGGLNQRMVHSYRLRYGDALASGACSASNGGKNSAVWTHSTPNCIRLAQSSSCDPGGSSKHSSTAALSSWNTWIKSRSIKPKTETVLPQSMGWDRGSLVPCCLASFQGSWISTGLGRSGTPVSMQCEAANPVAGFCESSKPETRWQL